MDTERFEEWRVAAVCSGLRPDPVVGMLAINSPPRLVGKVPDRLGARHIVEPLGTVQRCRKTVERYLVQAGIDRSTTNLEGRLKDIDGVVAAVLGHQLFTLALARRSSAWAASCSRLAGVRVIRHGRGDSGRTRRAPGPTVVFGIDCGDERNERLRARFGNRT